MLNQYAKDLISAGLTQQDIVKLIRKKNADIHQSTISRLLNDKRQRINFQAGMALKELHAEVCTEEPKKSEKKMIIKGVRSPKKRRKK